jgi:hypothetical protein
MIYIVGGLFHDYLCFLSTWGAVQVGHFSGLTKNNLRTINDLGDLVVYAGHSIVYNKYLFADSLHPLIDDMRSSQDFHSGHPSFLLGQFIQPLQCICQISSPDELFSIFF